MASITLVVTTAREGLMFGITPDTADHCPVTSRTLRGLHQRHVYLLSGDAIYFNYAHSLPVSLLVVQNGRRREPCALLAVHTSDPRSP
nr:hypothetical protein BgiMline_030452 [Biomphalaria glabrata]